MERAMLVLSSGPVAHQYRPPRGQDGYGTKMSTRNHSDSLAESEHHVINPTNPGGALDDGVKHRLHVRRRAADDTEHLGRCRLMFQSLGQLAIAFLSSLTT